MVAYNRVVREVRQVDNPTTSANTSANAHQRWRNATMRLRSGSARSVETPDPSCRCSIIDSPTNTSAGLHDRHQAGDTQHRGQQVHAKRQILAGQSPLTVEENDVIRKEHDAPC